MEAHGIVQLAVLLLAALYMANATDPSPLQDFCVATNDTSNTVVECTLYAGFVTENRYAGFVTENSRLFSKVLSAGDVFTIQHGLVHFQLNVGKAPASALVAFNSQNPGVVTIPNAMFGSTPLISVDVLAKAFQLDESVVKHLQSAFGTSTGY